MKQESSFLNTFPDTFSSTTESDFTGANSGYKVAQKLLLGQCKDLQAREDNLRKNIEDRDQTINDLTIAAGIYGATTWVNVGGVVLTAVGSVGIGLAFKAPISNTWQWGMAIFCLILSILGTLFPLLVRLIASSVANKHSVSTNSD